MPKSERKKKKSKKGLSTEDILKIIKKLKPKTQQIVKVNVGDKSDNIIGVPKYGKVKGQKVAEQGVETLPKEYHQLVEENQLIIDMSKNPNEPENADYVSQFLAVEDVCYDLDKIKKMFFSCIGTLMKTQRIFFS